MAGAVSQGERWLVTGAAGFIGSHLVEALLRDGQQVVGLDNFATGHRRNLDDVAARVGSAWACFEFVEGDICDAATCGRVMSGVDYVLHQAALGSVPRSIEAPLRSFAANVDGFVKVLDAAREAGVRRFVYAASSSTYGDHPALPKVEDTIGQPLSPYAATKYANEVFAAVYARTYGMSCVGLRYFNVFGARQDPAGAYAAVIPRWVSALLRGDPVRIFGDGRTSRDFCYVANAVQANLLAAKSPSLVAGTHEVFNVAVGEQTSLIGLFELIRDLLAQRGVDCGDARPLFEAFRAGDVRHSLASIDKARRVLGYQPGHDVRAGLSEAIDWYLQHR